MGFAADTAAGTMTDAKNISWGRNEMPDFCLGNCAFFGVGEPAADAAPSRQYLFSGRIDHDA